MSVSRRTVAKIIADRIDDGANLTHLSKEIAAYLLSSDRLSELNSIMRDVMVIQAEKGSVEALASSAHNLDDSVKEDIKELVKTIRPNAKKVLIDEKVDPSLVGGLKLSVINQSLDLTVRAKLNQLKQLTLQGGI